MISLLHKSGRLPFGRTRREIGAAGRLLFCFPFLPGLGTILDVSPARRFRSRAVGSNISLTPGIHGMMALKGSTSASYVKLRDLGDTDPVSIMGGANHFTFACWARTAALSGNQTLLGEGRSTDDIVYHTLYVTSAGVINFEYFAGGYVTLSSSVSITAGRWYHFAFSKGPTGRRTYLDGQIVMSDSSTASVSDSGSTTLMATTNGVGTFIIPWNGEMCGAVCYSGDMGPGFVQCLYRRPLSFLGRSSRIILPTQFTAASSTARSYFPGFI